MPSSTVNICVLALVLLSFQQIFQCRPHRSKRGLVKDYFVPDPLVFASDKFAKGDDGKYYLKKNAHRQDSEVKYISADNADRKNDIVPGVSEIETAKEDSKAAEAVNIKTDPTKTELLEKEAELVSGTTVLKESKEAVEKIDIKDDKTSFTPEDIKLTVPPKPDSKDEIALKTGLPFTESEEKVEDKVSIGQVPDLSSRLVPVPENIRIPILIPIRHISYRTMKIIPIPPAEVSDRLPVPYEDDIIGEGAHEFESEGVSEPLAEKESGYPIGNPLVSLLSFHNILKELKEADKADVEKESKVIDVLGKKFLLQSNVMKYPSSDDSHTSIRFLSMKPLEEMKPAEPKEIGTPEETLKKELEVEERKRIDMEKEEFAAKENKEIIEEKDMKEPEIKKETEEKLLKETEILKAEETELKMKVETNVPKEIVLKNVGKEENSDKIKSAAKEIKSVEEVLKETAVPHSYIDEADLKLIMGSKEMEIAEKAESQLKVKENKDIDMKKEISKQEDDQAPKMDAESNSDDESVLKMIKEEKANEKNKMEVVDTIMRKYEKKKMDMDSKKDFFLQEKKKKEKALEEKEEAKQKKKDEKKKKKCKCEEKDSDSDDDGEE